VSEVHHVSIKADGGEHSPREEFAVTKKRLLHREIIIRHIPRRAREGFHGRPHTMNRQAVVLVEGHAFTIRTFQSRRQRPGRITLAQEEQIRRFAGSILGELAA
jgi:hypothetical protein